MSTKVLTTVLLFLLGEIVLQAQTLNPLVLPGEIPMPTQRAEASKLDALAIGLRISDEVDDNALSDDRNKQANLLTVIEPHLGWTLSDSRAKWTLDYRPGFSMSHPLSTYNSRSDLLDTGLQLKLTKRLTARLHESFLESNNPFDQLRSSELTQGSSTLDRPSNAIIANARTTNQQASIDLIYAIASHDIIGTTGVFYRVSYSSAGNTQQLGSAKSSSAHGFYSHHLSRRNWIGLDYNTRDLITQEPRSQALVQSVFYTDTFLLTPNGTLSFFLGPEHSVTRYEPTLLPAGTGNVFLTRPNWNWAGGANYVLSDKHTSLAIGLSHRISDGAGLQGVVKLWSATAEVRRQLARKWKGWVLVSDDRATPLVATFTPISYVSAAAGLTRAVTPKLSLDFRYWRVHEVTSGVRSNPFLADHNRISTSLVYEFKTPVER